MTDATPDSRPADGLRPDFAPYRGQRLVQIQPATLPDLSTPYPYTIAPDWLVVGQDFWRGDPYALLGFQSTLDTQHVDLRTDQFLADPSRAKGMYPVFSRAGDGMYVVKAPVESVTVFDPADATPTPPPA